MSAVSCDPSHAEDNAVLINLRETDGREADFRMLDASGNPVPFTVVNVLDEDMGGEVKSYRLKPYENIFIRVDGI